MNIRYKELSSKWLENARIKDGPNRGGIYEEYDLRKIEKAMKKILFFIIKNELWNPRKLKVFIHKRNYWRHHTELLWRISNHGFLVSVSNKSEHDRCVFFYGGYESEQVGRICDMLKPCWDVIDVGAHLGMYTLSFSKAVGGKGKVLSIEPDPSLFRRLRMHCFINGCDNVITENCIISNQEKKYLTLYLTPEPQNNTIVKERQTEHVKSAGWPGCKESDLVEVQVKNLKLDNLISMHNLTPKLIKIDVEGAEFDVLSSCVKSIKKFHPLIYFESDIFDPNRKKVYDFLIKMNYSLYVYDSSVDSYIPGTKGKSRMILAIPEMEVIPKFQVRESQI